MDTPDANEHDKSRRFVNRYDIGMTLVELAWILGGYLSGSIPFALLLGLAAGVDVRRVGSGNVGATNLGRALGRKWGIFCFVLDVLKGLVPVVLAGAAMGYLLDREALTAAQAWKWLAVGAAAVLGHVFPVWLKFKGGKGVATSLGVLLGFWPTLTLPGVAALATWAAVLAVWRYVSLASVAAAIALPVYVLLLTLATGTRMEQAAPFLCVVTALGLLVVVRHRSNLARIMAGQEPRVGQCHGGDTTVTNN